MKRQSNYEGEYQELEKVVFKFFPLALWYFCQKCKKDFRREWGWRVLTGPFYNGIGWWVYFCKECCPTLVDAGRQARILPPRPPAPPPPMPPVKPPRRD